MPTANFSLEHITNKCGKQNQRHQDDIHPILAATLRWFMAGGAIRIALRQLLQNQKLRHL